MEFLGYRTTTVGCYRLHRRLLCRSQKVSLTVATSRDFEIRNPCLFSESTITPSNAQRMLNCFPPSPRPLIFLRSSSCSGPSRWHRPKSRLLTAVTLFHFWAQQSTFLCRNTNLINTGPFLEISSLERQTEDQFSARLDCGQDTG